MRSPANSIWRDENGAIASIYALVLPALIVVGGISFDYARLAAMDTELQNAADQAALAAATQLDGQADATMRAEEAASKLVSNITAFANDGAGSAVTIATVTFYSCATTECKADRSKANMTVVARDDTDVDDDNAARFVEVTVGAREAVYALTPVVGAIRSGDMDAAALAGLGSAVCRVPPVMMCNPEEPSTNIDVYREFDADSYQGIGIKLVSGAGYTPGSFGFLQTGTGGGTNDLLAALGWDRPLGNCAPIDGVEIKDGMSAAALDGINTRFDLPGTGNSCPTIGGVAGVCSPSVNVRKDLIRNPTGSGCGWGENDASPANFATRRYRPSSAAVLDSTVTPVIMGHPRDLCHAVSDTGVCADDENGDPGRIGTGEWDINAYWRSNYSGANYASQVSTTTYGPQPKGYPTRYQVYQYEIDNLGSTIGISKAGSGGTAYSQPQSGKCLATGSSPYGIVPGGGNIDRRRISVAVLNCHALADKYPSLNNKELETTTWADAFLVEPSFGRTKCKSGATCNTKYSDKKDVYVEIIGKTPFSGDDVAGQVIRRDVPYLIE